MDCVVDHFIDITEQFGESVEDLEHDLMEVVKPSHLDLIYAYKREINYLRRTIRPTRDLVVKYRAVESRLIEDGTIAYLKDLEDHVLHASESVETYQIMLNDQLNFYQSTIDNRLNEVLRILTVFSVIFIPLTFIAGIYGTNFKYLPELEYKYAYPIFWAVLLSIAAAMLLYFKKKKWF